MPELRNVTVHVTDAKNRILPEYGVQRLKGNKKVSAYIKSETNKSFRISVQAKIPYSPTETPVPHKYPTRSKASESPLSIENDNDVPYIKLEDDDMDGLAHSDHESWSTRRTPAYTTPKKTFSSPLRLSNDHQLATPPPYHILVSLYLDGRQMPERRAIVYLDPYNPDFDRVVRIKSRMVQNRCGTLTEHAWVFKDVGIETIFEKMLINGNLKEETVEDEMIVAFGSAGLGAEVDVAREEMSRVGKIVVELRRVTLGDKTVKSNFKAKHQEGVADDVDMGGIRPDIAHSTGFSYTRTLTSEPIGVVEYMPYKTSEGVFATFQFFYRSQGHKRPNILHCQLADCVAETLCKLNLLPVAQEQGGRLRTRTTINQDYSSITPLSIAKAQDKKARAPKPKAEGFKVGKEVNKPVMKPEHNFRDHRGDEAANAASKKQLEEQLISTLVTLSQTKSVNPTRNSPDAPQPPPPPPPTPTQPPLRQTSNAVLVNPSDAVHVQDTTPLSSLKPATLPATQASESSLKPRAITDSPSDAVTTSIFNDLLSNGIFRDPVPDCDEADDEQDNPDLEHYDKCNSYNIEFNPDEDDQGLHERLNKVAIGKRRRSNDVDQEMAVESDDSGHLEETGITQDSALVSSLGDGQDGGTEKIGGLGRRVRQRRNANTVDEACNAKAIEGLRFSEVTE